MTTTRSGIPTIYHETRFRSRLEARWAVFLDLVEWSWTYEPFDTPYWIPDFAIRGDAPLLIEVGPCLDLADFQNKARSRSRPTRSGETSCITANTYRCRRNGSR